MGGLVRGDMTAFPLQVDCREKKKHVPFVPFGFVVNIPLATCDKARRS